MRNNVTMLVAALAQGAGEAVRDAGGTRQEVAVAVMRAARAAFVAPEEDEAFAGACGALAVVLPDEHDRVIAEALAIGDRGRLMAALLDGVPVDLDRADLAPMPDDPIGLLECWDESAPERLEPRTANGS